MNREIIAYNPKEILKYVDKMGYVIKKDLEVKFGYSRSIARIIDMDMTFALGLLDNGEYKTVDSGREDGRKMSCLSSVLSKVGKATKDYELTERVLCIERLPTITKVGASAFNKAVEEASEDDKDFMKLPEKERNVLMRKHINELVDALDPVELSRFETEKGKISRRG